MSDKIYNVLFVCTGNSARSIMAEVIMNQIGREHFKAFSAGIHPRGEIHPLTLETLANQGHSLEGLRSKSWEEFTQPDSPQMDFIFTVCDQAAGESCPTWPGQPITAHWGFPDPAAATGSRIDQLKAFQSVQSQIATRIKLFLNLPINKIDRMSLQSQICSLGKKKVLFLCDGNADRSQMAEGLLRKLDNEHFDVHSAGIEPRPLNPLAVTVMQEISIDIAGHRSKHLNDYMDTRFDYIITLCDKVNSSCMSFPRDGHVIHWQCTDPESTHGDETQKLAAFRSSRDELASHIKIWLSNTDRNSVSGA
jgi:arsenate reductase